MDSEGQIALSVVIACYNAETTLGEQLLSLSQQQWNEPWEVIVVDNRSRDGSRHIVEAFQGHMSRLRLVDAFERQGAAYAMNAGVRAARGEALAFCDADDIVAPGWVAAMGEGLKRHAFVSGPHDTELLNHSPLAKHRSNPQKNGIQAYTYPPYLPHAGAGNLGVRRDVYDAVGGFDETLDALFDTDFCWKVQLRGIPLTPLPEAVLYVRHRDRPRDLIRQARKYAEYDVVLYKRYRRFGMPPLPKRKGIKAWIDLVLEARDATREETRAKYLWDLGWRTGRLIGSLRNGVWAL